MHMHRFISPLFMVSTIAVAMVLSTSCKNSNKAVQQEPIPKSSPAAHTPPKAAIPTSESHVDYDAFLRGLYGDRYQIAKDSLERVKRLRELGLVPQESHVSSGNPLHDLVEGYRRMHPDQDPMKDLMSKYSRSLNNASRGGDSDYIDDLEYRISELEDKINELESELDEYR